MDKISVDEAKAYELMSKEAGFKIVTLKKDIDFNSKEYEQLNLDGIQKSQLNALIPFSMQFALISISSSDNNKFVKGFISILNREKRMFMPLSSGF